MFCTNCGEKIKNAAKFCKKCGNKVPIKIESFNDEFGLFLTISTAKLAVLSILTFGLYEIYWLYKQWKAIKIIKKTKIMAWARALFGVLFAYSLFKEIQSLGKTHAKQNAYASGWLATSFFILSTLWRLPDPVWLISLLAFLPLIPVQKFINNNLVKNSSSKESFTKFNGWEIFMVIAGGIWTLLVIYGMIPE